MTIGGRASAVPSSLRRHPRRRALRLPRGLQPRCSQRLPTRALVCNVAAAQRQEPFGKTHTSTPAALEAALSPQANLERPRASMFRHSYLSTHMCGDEAPHLPRVGGTSDGSIVPQANSKHVRTEVKSPINLVRRRGARRPNADRGRCRRCLGQDAYNASRNPSNVHSLSLSLSLLFPSSRPCAAAAWGCQTHFMGSKSVGGVLCLGGRTTYARSL